MAVSLNGVPGQKASAAAGASLEMQILDPHCTCQVVGSGALTSSPGDPGLNSRLRTTGLARHSPDHVNAPGSRVREWLLYVIRWHTHPHMLQVNHALNWTVWLIDCPS